MNIFNKFFLKMVLLPAGIYKSMGVDITHLKTILNTKLLIDDRRPSAIVQTRKKKKAKQVKLATIGTMIVSAILGAVYLYAFAVGKNEVTQLTIYCCMFFVMLSATLISDFTSVLMDVRDNFIILPKPVNDKTVVVAKLLHILIHICKVVLPMSIPGIIYMGVEYGFGALLLFFLMILFVTLFAVFFINALYILILRITTPQKFQSIISYVQIALAVIIYAGYQIIPRMTMQLRGLDFTTMKPMHFVPLYWFAQAWNTLYTMHGDIQSTVATLLAVLLPIASLYIIVKYLAPSFNNRFALIHSVGTANITKENTVVKQQSRQSYPDLLSKLFTRSNAERMGFLFTWKMTSRSKDFKMKVYPSMGYFLVYVVVMFMNSRKFSMEELLDQNGRGKLLVISALYFTSLILIMALNQIVYSEKFKASWIYYIAPVYRPGEIVIGGIKAAILKFYIPIVVAILLAGSALIGPSVLPNIILGLFNELLIVTMIAYVNHKQFPFSTHQNTSIKAGSFIRNMGVYMLSAIIATGHYFIYTFIPVVIICAVLSIIATWLMMSSIKNISWATIKNSYTED